MAPTKLGIIAGSGPLPGNIARSCQTSGREVFIVAFEGETEPQTCTGAPHVWLRLGAVGELLRQLKRAGCHEIVLAGPIRRPSFKTLKLDMRGLKLMGKIGRAMGRGDDALFSIIVQELEDEGFRVVGADTVLAELAAAEGVLGRVAPDDEALRDIELGCRVARSLGTADVGQAVIVHQGVVLGVEAVEGTDALIERCAALRREGSGGVLVKLKKPDQERRVDLPTIGANTITRAAEAGLSGVAVEAGESLILDREAVIAEADERGLFVVGIASP